MQGDISRPFELSLRGVSHCLARAPSLPWHHLHCMPCTRTHACLLRSTTGAMGTAEGPGRHVCDVLELPRPGRGFDCTPTAADPLLISYLIGNDKVDKYHRWGCVGATVLSTCHLVLAPLHAQLAKVTQVCWLGGC